MHDFTIFIVWSLIIGYGNSPVNIVSRRKMEEKNSGTGKPGTAGILNIVADG